MRMENFVFSVASFLVSISRYHDTYFYLEKQPFSLLFSRRRQQGKKREKVLSCESRDEVESKTSCGGSFLKPFICFITPSLRTRRAQLLSPCHATIPPTVFPKKLRPSKMCFKSSEAAWILPCYHQQNRTRQTQNALLVFLSKNPVLFVFFSWDKKKLWWLDYFSFPCYFFYPAKNVLSSLVLS